MAHYTDKNYSLLFTGVLALFCAYAIDIKIVDLFAISMGIVMSGLGLYGMLFGKADGE